MKTLVSSILILLSICQTACSKSSDKNGLADSAPVKLEGVINGGGGKGIQCGNTVRLLDLYEGELKGYPKPVSSGNFDENLNRIIPKISDQLSMPGEEATGNEFHKAFFNHMISKIIDIPNNEKLEFTDDANLPPLPSGCQFVQIAVHTFGDVEHEGTLIKVYRDNSLWKMMPLIDQVALLSHEYIFSITRKIAQVSVKSDDTRALVAKMFSGLETYPTYSPIWKVRPLSSCGFIQGKDDGYVFLMAKEEKDGLIGTGFYFSNMSLILQVSRTYSFIPGILPEDFTDEKKQFQVSTLLENHLLDRKWNFEIQKTASQQWAQFRLTKLGEPTVDFFSWGMCGNYEKPIQGLAP